MRHGPTLHPQVSDAEVQAFALDGVRVFVAGPVAGTHDEVEGFGRWELRCFERRHTAPRRVGRMRVVLAAGLLRLVDLVDDLARARDVVRRRFPREVLAGRYTSADGPRGSVVGPGPCLCGSAEHDRGDQARGRRRSFTSQATAG